MAESKKGVLLSHDRKHVTSRVDDFASIEMGNELFLKTVRVSTCEILVSSGKCRVCVQYIEDASSVGSKPRKVR